MNFIIGQYSFEKIIPSVNLYAKKPINAPKIMYILTNPSKKASENINNDNAEIIINITSSKSNAIFPGESAVLNILNTPYNTPRQAPRGIDHKNAVDCWAKVNSKLSPRYLNSLESFERELSLPIYCIAPFLPSITTSPV